MNDRKEEDEVFFRRHEREPGRPKFLLRRKTITFDKTRDRFLSGEREKRFNKVIKRLLDQLVEPQKAFATDTARRVSGCCSRQCGKSYTGARRLIIRALKKDRAYCLAVNATHHEAAEVFWDDATDGIPAILRDVPELIEGNDFELNHTKKTVTFSNGSRVQIIGLDSDNFSKLRGRKIDEILIDESQKAIGLEKAFRDVLFFALQHKGGTIVMTGTPDEFCSGFFHDVDTGKIPGWSTHHWGRWDLEEVYPGVWDAVLASKEENGWEDDDPSWLREGLGKWVRGGLGLIFAATERYTDLPSTIPGTDIPFDYQWKHVIGVDIGYDPDPWAWVVLAFSRHSKDIFEIESGKIKQLDTDGQIEKLSNLIKTYKPIKTVVDAGALGKQIAEDYKNRGKLHVEAAEKHDKAKAVEVLQTDVKHGRFKTQEDSALELEMAEIGWHQREWDKGKKVFDGVHDDHCIDAGLYAHRVCKHMLSTEPEIPLSEEQLDELRRQQDFERAIAHKKIGKSWGRNSSWR